MKTLIAVLASHNRREKTLACLKAFFANGSTDCQLSAVLLDDGSTDNTAERVMDSFGDAVTVIRGDGSHFWNGGMRRAIETAQLADPDYLLWLNDDTLIDGDAVARLLSTYHQTALGSEATIVVGAIRDPSSPEVITYGGLYRARRLQRTKWSRLPESINVQHCETMNGNCVLVPRAVFARVGNLSPDFTHSMGDLDYGLRARAHGCQLVVPPGSVGTCARNSAMGTFEDTGTSLLKRWKHIVSVKGLPPREWAIFTRHHAGPLWLLYWMWPYVRVVISSIFPRQKIQGRA